MLIVGGVYVYFLRSIPQQVVFVNSTKKEYILFHLISVIVCITISNDLTWMVNFPTQIPDCDSQRPARALSRNFGKMMF